MTVNPSCGVSPCLVKLVDNLVDRSTVYGSFKLTAHSTWFTVAWYVQMVHSSQLTAYSSQVDRCDISPPLVYPVTVAFQACVNSIDSTSWQSWLSPLHHPNVGRIHNVTHFPGFPRIPGTFISSPMSSLAH